MLQRDNRIEFHKPQARQTKLRNSLIINDNGYGEALSFDPNASDLVAEECWTISVAMFWGLRTKLSGSITRASLYALARDHHDHLQDGARAAGLLCRNGSLVLRTEVPWEAVPATSGEGGTVYRWVCKDPWGKLFVAGIPADSLKTVRVDSTAGRLRPRQGLSFKRLIGERATRRQCWPGSYRGWHCVAPGGSRPWSETDRQPVAQTDGCHKPGCG